MLYLEIAPFLFQVLHHEAAVTVMGLLLAASQAGQVQACGHNRGRKNRLREVAQSVFFCEAGELGRVVRPHIDQPQQPGNSSYILGAYFKPVCDGDCER